MAIVRKDKLLAGYNGNLESVMVHDNEGINQVTTTNGVFVVLAGLMPNEREVKKARLASKNDVAEKVLLVHSPEVMYDERKWRLEDFVIPAGKPARAYHLFDGDVITLTKDLFVGTLGTDFDIGDELVAHTDGKLGKDDTALANAKVVFEVIEDCGYELTDSMKAYAVQVKIK